MSSATMRRTVRLLLEEPDEVRAEERGGAGDGDGARPLGRPLNRAVAVTDQVGVVLFGHRLRGPYYKTGVSLTWGAGDLAANAGAVFFEARRRFSTRSGPSRVDADFLVTRRKDPPRRRFSRVQAEGPASSPIFPCPGGRTRVQAGRTRLEAARSASRRKDPCPGCFSRVHGGARGRVSTFETHGS